MPLGDSITTGKGGDPPYAGFRDDLYFMLLNMGFDFDFVGSLSDGFGFDSDHEGHPGWKADQVLAEVDTWLVDSDPDVILLHIGTNDVSSGQPNSQTIVEIEGILDKIYNYKPQIKILFCKLIPRRVTWENEYIYNERLNVRIESLFNEKKTQGYDIYLVDQFSAFDKNSNWADEYMVDNVHPNDIGYHVMAETYFQVLQPLLAERTHQIAGSVQYYSNQNPIDNVIVYLAGSQSDRMLTNFAGSFQFGNLTAGEDFSVRLEKDKLDRFQNNVITMYSAALTLRHAVGVDTLNPNQQSAADVDKNGSITAFDAALIARYAVELDPFGQDHVGEWRFVPDSLNYDSLEADYFDANFTGILLGDVAGAWSQSGMAKAGNFDYALAGKIEYHSSNKISVPIIVHSDSLLSFAGELDFPENALRFRGAKFLREEHLLVNHRKGKVKFGFYLANILAVSDTIGRLEFEVVREENWSDVDVAVKFQINQAASQMQLISLNGLCGHYAPSLTVGNNYPNPFNPTTVVPYDVKVAGNLDVKIFNALGQEVKGIFNHSVVPGKYELKWDGRDDFGVNVADGVYVCRFQLDRFVQNRTLLKLK